MLYNYPQIYDYNFPESFVKENPNIDNAIKKKHVQKAPWQNKVTLTTSAGQNFESFAKFTEFEAGKTLDTPQRLYRGEFPPPLHQLEDKLP